MHRTKMEFQVVRKCLIKSIQILYQVWLDYQCQDTLGAIQIIFDTFLAYFRPLPLHVTFGDITCYPHITCDTFISQKFTLKQNGFRRFWRQKKLRKISSDTLASPLPPPSDTVPFTHTHTSRMSRIIWMALTTYFLYKFVYCLKDQSCHGRSLYIGTVTKVQLKVKNFFLYFPFTKHYIHCMYTIWKKLWDYTYNLINGHPDKLTWTLGYDCV